MSGHFKGFRPKLHVFARAWESPIHLESDGAPRAHSDYLIWAAADLVLVIPQLITGTFYLLGLGIAAVVGAGVAFLRRSPSSRTLIRKT